MTELVSLGAGQALPADGRRNVSSVDAESLAAELRRTIQGEVRFDEGSRALYARGVSDAPPTDV